MLYFGILKDRFGVAEEQVELLGEGNVGELLGLLRGRTSNSAMGDRGEDAQDERLWRSLAVAVNREYAQPSIALRDGDEVALLPPVSGGLLRVGRKASFARAGCGAMDCGALALLANGLCRKRTL